MNIRHIITLLLSCVLLVGCAATDELSKAAQEAASADVSGATKSTKAVPIISEAKARQLIGRLPVLKSQVSMAGYDRAKFPHWKDLNKNGCDAREDALINHGKNVKKGAGCKITSGTWLDPYSGETYTNPRQLDIDHIIPLAAAWRRGAGSWTTAKRTNFANDPQNTLPVYLSLNRQKGDKTAEAWKPPARGYWCVYARKTVQVHFAYRLPLTAPEKQALLNMLGTC